MSGHLDKPNWGPAMGKVVSGLFVITIKSSQEETGFLGSWVQQCSFDPPQLTIAVNNQRPVLGLLAPGTPLTVNVLPHGGKSLIAHFGKGFAPGEPAFEGLNVERGDGAPRLLDALAWLDTRVVSAINVGDHTLVIVKVLDGNVLQDGQPTTHTRRDGSKY